MAITATERAQIIELTVLMFNAAPGATYLSQIVSIYESNGHNLQTLAQILGGTAPYISLNPNFQTAEEFAANLLTPLGLKDDDFATDFIVGMFNSGMSKGDIAYVGLQELLKVTDSMPAIYVNARDILLNKSEVATYYSVEKGLGATDLATLQNVVSIVTADDASVTAAKHIIDDNTVTGETFTLTTGVDNILATTGDDTINALLDTAGGTGTLSNLDTIHGGTGTDTLAINDVDVAGSAFPTSLTVTGVENIEFRGAGAVTLDTTTNFADLGSISVTKAVNVDVTAGAATAVSVSGASGNVIVDGGASQTVATSGAGAAVTLSGSAGDISVAHTKQGAGVITVDGGANVVIAATGETTGTITVGGVTAPTGSVGINSTGAASVAGANAALGAINVTGGTNVAIEQHATSSSAAAAADAVGATITQGAVTVTGTATTTAVSVKQDMEVAVEAAVAAVAGANETAAVTFTALAIGEAVTVDGLTFTAAKALTAAQVAAAFANLSAGVTQGSAPAGNGIYTGMTSDLYTSGAVTLTGTVPTVTFTSVDQDNVADLAVAGVGATAVVTQGVFAVDAAAGVLGVAAGAVTVNGAKIATVSLDSYAASTVTSDALTSLSLANSVNSLTVTNAAATTLALALDNVADDAVVDLGATYTTLNVTTGGSDSDVTLTAGGVTALTVSGTKALDLTGAVLTALKTVTVSGSAGVKADVSAVATVTSVDASGTSGANTFTIDAATAAYTGGSGADKVTLSTGLTTKAVSLGAGDDSLTLAAGTVALTAVMTGGDGTDTLKMAAADATAVSAASLFEAKIDGFEKLSLTGSVAADVVDLSNLDDISYVISDGNAVSLTLNKMAAGGTVELTGAGVLTKVALTDATGTADTLNVVTKVVAADVAFGTVEAAGVESIAITATDSNTTAGAGAGVNTATLALTDAALKTVTVTGNGNLTLTASSTVLTSIDGSAMTGKLNAVTNGTVAQTITGGSAADTLTGHATGSGDVLLGGAGGDTLIVMGNLTTLTGGAGADTFNVADATSNVNSYASITDLAAGDKIQFSATADSFVASKVTLAETAVFQDYANQAIAISDTSDVAWFQYGGNTYIIENVSNGTSFVNSQDIIVKIVGAVDLSTASFSADHDTLLIV